MKPILQILLLILGWLAFLAVVAGGIVLVVKVFLFLRRVMGVD